MRKSFFWAAFLCASCMAVGAADTYVPEAGSVERRAVRNNASNDSARVLDPALPHVLIIGDSISLGYTPFVRERLKSEAHVVHSPGNSQGTTHGLEALAQWIKPLNGKPWSVIHFNWGLHDLKRVKQAGSQRNSDDPHDPRQAELPVYEANLRRLVAMLKQTGAKLIFATTTPYPKGVSPWRDPEDAGRYNAVALKIMAENGVAIDDLYSYALPMLGEWQQPQNVHFTGEGSKALAEKVAESIIRQLSP